jgi:hypothetical protein
LKAHRIDILKGVIGKQKLWGESLNTAREDALKFNPTHSPLQKRKLMQSRKE